MNYSAGFTRILNIINVLVVVVFAVIVGVLQFSPMDTLKIGAAGLLSMTVISVLPNDFTQWVEKKGVSRLRLAWLRLVAIMAGGILSIYTCFISRAAFVKLNLGEFLGVTAMIAFIAAPIAVAALVHVLTGGLGRAAGYVADGFKQEK